MELTLLRRYKGVEYTIGTLSVNGQRFCDTLEDKVRDLNADGDLNDEGEGKVYGKTAIPYGTYEITLDIVSPKFSQYRQYKNIGGKLPRLLNVSNFEGVLIHIGNSSADTNGCILVGENTVKGRLTNSTNTFNRLYAKLLSAKVKGEKITITIK